MDMRRTFYKVENGGIKFRQINFEHHVVNFDDEYSVYTAWGSKQKREGIERKKFNKVMEGYDYYMEISKKHKAEYNDHPWTSEVKYTMNLEKQKNTLTQEEFDKFLKKISRSVEDFLWKTICGEVSRGLKKIKGSLYSIRIYMNYQEPAMQELLRQWLVQITENADIVLSNAQEQVFTQIPEYNGTKDMEIEFWTENSGFIFFTMTLGEYVFESRFSDVWDPGMDLRSWLEAIVTGVEECSFLIQNEGEDTKFHFLNWGKDRCVFYAGWSRDEMSIVAHVDRHQFVKALYTGYLSFIDPNTFPDKKNWDLDMATKFKSEVIEEFLKEN